MHVKDLRTYHLVKVHAKGLTYATVSFKGGVGLVKCAHITCKFAILVMIMDTNKLTIKIACWSIGLAKLNMPHSIINTHTHKIKNINKQKGKGKKTINNSLFLVKLFQVFFLCGWNDEQCTDAMIYVHTHMILSVFTAAEYLVFFLLQLFSTAVCVCVCVCFVGEEGGCM